MHVISKSRLRAFWLGLKDRKEAAIAQRDATAWFKAASAKRFKDFADLKQTFGSADQVGNCTVFDVGNNRFRVIGRVNYRMHRIYVLAMLTHAEYDRRRWIADCGCDQPPPKRPSASRREQP